MKLHSLGKLWICALLFFFCASGGPVAAQEEGASSLFAVAALSGVGFEFYGGWESKYAAEGRDDLPGSGVYVSGVSVGYGSFSAAFDLIGGDEVGYREVNYGIGYGREFQGVEFGVGYTRLEFHDNDNHNEPTPGDNEWSAEVSYGGLPFISPSLAFVYADNRERSGSFLELALAADLPLDGYPVSVSPYVSQSFDFGYRTKENDGFNNLQIGVEVGFEIKKGASITGHLNHSFKQKDIKEEMKADSEARAAGTWGGVSLSLSL